MSGRRATTAIARAVLGANYAVLEQLNFLVDLLIVPKARAIAKPVNGFKFPQLMLLDVSGPFVRYATNLFASLKKIGQRLDERVLVIAESLSTCISLLNMTHNCLATEWLFSLAGLLVKETGEDSKMTNTFLVVRYILLYRLTNAGIGTMLLDSDVVFLRDLYGLTILKEYDMVFANNLGLSRDMHCFRGWLEGSTYLRTIAIPPVIFQPTMASTLEIILEGQVALPDMVRPFCDLLNDFRYVEVKEESLFLKLQGKKRPLLTVAGLNCSICQSECYNTVHFVGRCWNTESKPYTYHANCAGRSNVPALKEQTMQVRKAWFI